MNKIDRVELFEQTFNDLLSDSGTIQFKLMMDGFFAAPASTKYHGAYEGGLFDHSHEVMCALLYMTENMHLSWTRPESPYIIGMFHDLCKTDAYIKVVDREGIPTLSETTYKFEHNPKMLLQGHGEKSVMLLSQLMSLTEEEVLCIRYHMGAYEKDDWEGYDRAIRKYPNVLWTHTADMLASKVVGV